MAEIVNVPIQQQTATNNKTYQAKTFIQTTEGHINMDQPSNKVTIV